MDEPHQQCIESDQHARFDFQEMRDTEIKKNNASK